MYMNMYAAAQYSNLMNIYASSGDGVEILYDNFKRAKTKKII